MRKTRRKIFMMILVLAMSAAVIFITPAYALAADDTNPELLQLPDLYGDSANTNEALLRQIEDLKKVIKLNVTEAESIPVLLYHHVVNEKDITPDQESNTNIISTELFTEHMKYLYDNNYYTASVEELEQFIAGKLFLPQKTVVITFDDGYRSNTRICYPILKKYDFKASIFLITSLIGERENVIEHASWNDLNRCADVFSYYSHSFDMHKLNKDGKSSLVTSSLSTIKRDMLLSRAIVNTAYYSYPYGQSNQGVINTLKKTGYRMGFTIEPGYVTKRMNTYAIPRFTILPNTSTETFVSIVSGTADSPAFESEAAG